MIVNLARIKSITNVFFDTARNFFDSEKNILSEFFNQIECEYAIFRFENSFGSPGTGNDKRFNMNYLMSYPNFYIETENLVINVGLEISMIDYYINTLTIKCKYLEVYKFINLHSKTLKLSYDSSHGSFSTELSFVRKNLDYVSYIIKECSKIKGNEKILFDGAIPGERNKDIDKYLNSFYAKAIEYSHSFNKELNDILKEGFRFRDDNIRYMAYLLDNIEKPKLVCHINTEAVIVHMNMYKDLTIDWKLDLYPHYQNDEEISKRVSKLNDGRKGRSKLIKAMKSLP